MPDDEAALEENDDLPDPPAILVEMIDDPRVRAELEKLGLEFPEISLPYSIPIRARIRGRRAGEDEEPSDPFWDNLLLDFPPDDEDPDVYSPL